VIRGCDGEGAWASLGPWATGCEEEEGQDHAEGGGWRAGRAGPICGV
jgi:hypothetical protein